VTGIVLGAIFALICVFLLRRVWQGRVDWIDAGAWTAVALLATASSLLPWYVVWLLPLAALGTDRRLWRVAIVMTAVVEVIQLIDYVPHIRSLGL
jgi:hypothetical protein